MNSSEFENRVQYLTDQEAIRRLKHYHYCHCVDRMVAGETAAGDELTARFCEDIVADFTGFPVAEGQAAVIEFYTQVVPSILSWCQHQVMNEVIDIDGDTATASWYVDVPSMFRDNNVSGVSGSGVISGRYQETYVKIDGQWKWKKIVALLDVFNDMESHWRNATHVFSNR